MTGRSDAAAEAYMAGVFSSVDRYMIGLSAEPLFMRTNIDVCERSLVVRPKVNIKQKAPEVHVQLAGEPHKDRQVKIL